MTKPTTKAGLTRALHTAEREKERALDRNLELGAEVRELRNQLHHSTKELDDTQSHLNRLVRELSHLEGICKIQEQQLARFESLLVTLAAPEKVAIQAEKRRWEPFVVKKDFRGADRLTRQEAGADQGVWKIR